MSQVMMSYGYYTPKNTSSKARKTQPSPRFVDMTGLKELARKRLGEASMLRKLIEREKDSINYDEWLSKMEVYGRLLEEETTRVSQAGL